MTVITSINLFLNKRKKSWAYIGGINSPAFAFSNTERDGKNLQEFSRE